MKIIDFEDEHASNPDQHFFFFGLHDIDVIYVWTTRIYSRILIFKVSLDISRVEQLSLSTLYWKWSTYHKMHVAI